MSAKQASVDPTALAMQTVSRAIHSDIMYAWSWWCILVMNAIDEGVTREQAEASANRTMVMAFGFDMMATDFYKEEHARRHRAMVEGKTFEERLGAASHFDPGAHGSKLPDSALESMVVSLKHQDEGPIAFIDNSVHMHKKD